MCYSHDATRVNYLLALLVYSGSYSNYKQRPAEKNDVGDTQNQQRWHCFKAEITSNYPDEPRGLTKQISKSVLDKYLHEDYPCLDAMERLMYRIVPYWNISLPRMRKNISDVIDARWEFDYISENKPALPADKQITSSLMQEINDEAVAGKNISM